MNWWLGGEDGFECFKQRFVANRLNLSCPACIAFIYASQKGLANSSPKGQNIWSSWWNCHVNLIFASERDAIVEWQKRLEKREALSITFPFALLFWWLGSTAITFLPAPLFGVLIPVFCFVFWSPTLSTLQYIRFETHVFPLYFHSIPIIFPFYSHYVLMRSYYIPLRILYVRVRSPMYI